MCGDDLLLTEAQRQAACEDIFRQFRAAVAGEDTTGWPVPGQVPPAFRVADPGEKIPRALSWYRWYGPAPWRQPGRSSDFLLGRND